MRRYLVTLAVVLIAVASQDVFAIDVDLTAAGSSGTLNGALYIQTDPAPTGSGVLQSFVRISDNDEYVQGYNTDGRPLQYNENTSPTFTRSLNLSSVPIVTIGGVAYREFILDINQINSDPLLTLNRVVVSLRPAGNLLGATVAPGSQLGAAAGLFTDDTLIYDSGAGNTITLDYTNDAGSGQGDMFLYIPNSLFVGPNQFVYLYSEFGVPNGNNDGFEEWAVRGAVSVPEPTSLLLLGASLVGLATARGRLIRRLRSRK